MCIFTDEVYQAIFDNDETWYVWSDGNALQIYDVQLLDY
jgi:hypothetical protein